MTSDLCTDDVAVRISTPQLISSESVMVSAAGGVGTVGGVGTLGGALGSRVAASSAAVELGRRLLTAARAGDTPLVLSLMAEGAPFTTDWLGTSPLHMAAAGGHADTCAVLLRAGVSRDARTKVERTPLHLAACGGHAAVAALLLDAGAAVDCRDMLRMTPLHWAVQRGYHSTTAVLVEAGADPLAQSKFGKTPRVLAALRPDLLRLLDATTRRPEPAPAPAEATAPRDEATEAVLTALPQTQTFLPVVQRAQEIKINRTKQQTDKVLKTDIKTEASGGGGSVAGGAAARLLRAHGITLLPADHSTTVLNALQSGRTVVLSDAGKLMLKESVESVPPPPPPADLSPVPSPAPPQRNMVLTATPVRTPPRPGMKIFTLNNKVLTIPRNAARVPVKRIINPQDMQHVKLVQLPADAKLVSPSRAGVRRAVAPRVSAGPGAGGGGGVKIIMNKSNFQRFVASANRLDTTPHSSAIPAATVEPLMDLDDVVVETLEAAGEVGEAAGEGEEEATSLRVQLAAARRSLASLRGELRAAHDLLRHYQAGTPG